MILRRQTVIGGGVAAILIVLGVLLPPQSLVLSFLPSGAAAYKEKVVQGLWCVKAGLVFNGLLLFVFPWLKRWFWDAGAITAAEPRRLFRNVDLRPLAIGESWTLAGILVFAVLLRLIGANAGFWGDEILVQQMFVSRGLPVIVSYWPPCTHHIGYEILAWCTQQLPLPVETAARLPAIGYGVAGVALSFWIARRFRVSPLGVAFLHSLSIFSIVHSQMVKGYTATLFFFLLAVLGIFVMAEQWRYSRGWLWFGVGLVGMLYNHLHTTLLAAGLTLSAVYALWYASQGVRDLRWILFRRMFLTLLFVVGVTFLLYSPVLPQLLGIIDKAKATSETGVSWDFFRGWGLQMTFWGWAKSLTVGFVLLAFLGFFSIARRELAGLVVLGLPVVFVLGATVASGSFIYPRYLVFMLPVFLLFMIEGALAIGRNVGRPLLVLWISLALYAVPTVLALNEYYRIGFQNIRGAVRLAVSLGCADDRIFGFGLARPLFPYYSSRVEPVEGIEAIREKIQSTPGDVYVLYAWRNAWKSRAADFDWLDRQFAVVARWDGTMMETSMRDGEVVLLKARKE